eukprot:754072-Hanusia_phi.AAC.1
MVSSFNSRTDSVLQVSFCLLPALSSHQTSRPFTLPLSSPVSPSSSAFPTSPATLSSNLSPHLRWHSQAFESEFALQTRRASAAIDEYRRKLEQ